MPSSKYPTSYRLSEECLKLIEELAKALGISNTAVIEQAIRKLAHLELGAKSATPARAMPGTPPAAALEAEAALGTHKPKKPKRGKA